MGIPIGVLADAGVDEWKGVPGGGIGLGADAGVGSRGGIGVGQGKEFQWVD